jgi:hypothetical protein
MTANQFRRLALALPGTEERSHMAHPDFRVGNKIFATVGYPATGWGMVRLSPEQQSKVIRAAPEVFRPAAGAWGQAGSTLVQLASAKVTQLRPILSQAYENLIGRATFNPAGGPDKGSERRRAR